MPNGRLRGFDLLRHKLQREDVFLPTLARLAERHLEGVTDRRDELDRAFQAALRKYPRVTDDVLQRLVDDYKAIPAEVRRLRFPRPIWERALRVPLAISELRDLVERVQPYLRLRPDIERLEPIQPLYGYVPGQQVRAIGGPFSQEPGATTVEIWFLDPDEPAKKFTCTPTNVTLTEVTFFLPADIEPGTWHLRAAVDGAGVSDYVPFTVASPEITITNVTGPNMQPGSWIVIDGEGFVAGQPHKVTFQNMDLAVSDLVEVTGVVPESVQQMKVQIPNGVTAGNNAIRVSCETSPTTAPSLLYMYSVGVPSYELKGLRLHCYDETNWAGTEWGADEVRVTWLVVADSQVYDPQTTGYYSMNEGDEKTFTPTDSKVFLPPPDGGFGEVKYGLAVVTALVEIDDPDFEVFSDILGFAGKIAEAIMGSGGKWVKKVADYLDDVVKWALCDEGVTVGYDASDPAGHPGPIAENWYAQRLQGSLVGPNTNTGEISLDFHGDDDHGWYRVWYAITRK